MENLLASLVSVNSSLAAVNVRHSLIHFIIYQMGRCVGVSTETVVNRYVN